MKLRQQFTVARPLADVWAFFQDVPAVARCMPGAALTDDKGDGVYAGKVKVRLGPFGADFEGEAKVTPDPATHSGHVEGKGVDRRGGSRTRMVMDYRLAPAAGGTEVTVDADVTLAGAIAQFGRTSLIQETANILVQDFAGALEAQLAPPPTAETPVTLRADTAPVEAASPEGPRPAATAERPRAPETTPTARQTGRPMPPASAPRPEPAAPREISAGSVALRALWAWLKNLVRGMVGADRR